MLIFTNNRQYETTFVLPYRNWIHHVTIPNHNPLRIGTLSNILSDIADHFQLSKKDLLEKLF
jgi:hypothetical protein